MPARRFILFACPVFAAFAWPAGAGAVLPEMTGKIGTLPHGRYLCELPGDAAGPASVPVDGAWFDVINGSSYVSETGKGTYLRMGKNVVFTRGPMRGALFRLSGPRVLQRTNLEGPLARMRCVRSGPAAD
ncbi:elongation factor P [Altererythrobacter aerius]|uniref:Elongation factor P n=1 Tax=Tsuneonella aeria TaxID=1837929 RepID=A0A6I4T9G0_9SPHN|nr:elongation factor P [Tsuneonella aeria]MXO73961.1 elongation factor P [Tsuneonella aeria]